MKLDAKEPLKSISGDGDDLSDSSIDDEDGELLTEDLENVFYKVLSRLKKKDSKLYDENVKFFPVELSENASELKNNVGKRSVAEYKEWLKGQKDKVEDEGVKKDLEALHDFWTSPKLNKGEKFLRDYILNKKFLDPDDNFNVEKEIEKLEEEEKEIDEQVTFEHNYNCRFENPDEQFLKKYPNIMKNSTGKKKNKSDFKISNKSEFNDEPVTIKQSKKRKKKCKENGGDVESEEVDKLGTNNKITRVINEMKVGSQNREVLEDSDDVESSKKTKVVVKEVSGTSPERKNMGKEELSDKSLKRKKVSENEEDEESTAQEKRKDVKKPRYRKKRGSMNENKLKLSDAIDNSVIKVNMSNKNENSEQNTMQKQPSSGTVEKNDNDKKKIRKRNTRRKKRFSKIKAELAKEQLQSGTLEKKEGSKRKRRHKQLFKLIKQHNKLQNKQFKTVQLKTEHAQPKLSKKKMPSNFKVTLAKNKNREKRMQKQKSSVKKM